MSAPGPRRIGVFGGAFNPPHVGHLVLAEEAASDLGLERVLLVPTGRPAHKTLTDDPGGEARLRMVDAGVGTSRLLDVEPFEVEAASRDGVPSYMHITLEAVQRRETDAELVLVLGTDAASKLAQWEAPERVLELASIAVASRPGSDVAAAERGLREAGAEGWELVEMPQLEVSSTEVRERIGAGRPYRYLVGPDVAGVIEAEGLYR